MARFYVTKYALTAGIIEIDSEKSTSSYHKAGEFSVKDTRPNVFGWNSFTNKEAFEDRAEAVADAEARRVQKIASLKKQIAKLEKLSFN